MKIIMESTDKITKLNGERVRIWEGKTDSGIPCFAMIARVGVHNDSDASQFQTELKECGPPSRMTDWLGRDLIFEADLD